MQGSRGKGNWKASLGPRQGVLRPREAPGLYFSGIRKPWRDLELLTDVSASWPGAAASCSFKCSFLLLCFLFAISAPNGECVQKPRQLFTSPF